MRKWLIFMIPMILTMLFSVNVFADDLYYGPTSEDLGTDAYASNQTQWRAQVVDVTGATSELIPDYTYNFDNGDMQGVQYDGGISNLRVENGKLIFDVNSPGRIWWGDIGTNRDRSKQLELGKNWPHNIYSPAVKMLLQQSLTQSDMTMKVFGERGPSDFSQTDCQLNSSTLQNILISREAVDSGNADSGSNWENYANAMLPTRIHTPFRGVAFEFKTPGNHIEIGNVNFGHIETKRYLRKTITLSQVPLKADFSLVGGEYELYINGELALSYHNFMGARLPQHVDGTSFLNNGENSIAIISFSPRVALQGGILLTDGQRVSVQTDTSWRASAVEQDGWMGVNFDDSEWTAPKIVGSVKDIFDHRNVLKPIYDGLIGLTATPEHPAAPSNPYISNEIPPIFDFSEGAKFNFSLPIQTLNPQAEYTLKYVFKDAWSGEVAAQGEIEATNINGQDRVGRLEQRLDKPGVYELFLEWDSNGQIIDTRNEEVMLIGSIQQTSVTEDKVDQTLKLSLVDEIDCTNPNDSHPRLAYDSGYGHASGTFNLQTITTTSGKYLESMSSQNGETLRYQIDIPHPYNWYIIEFEYPDDADRAMAFGYEDRLWNGSDAVPFPRGDGGIHTGFGLPFTNKMQVQRIPIIPGKSKGTVYINNLKQGCKLAISKIRIYEVTGELPNVKPVQEETGRYFGIHQERPLYYYNFASFPGWDAFVVGLMNGPYYGNYKYWYRTYENYIRYLHYSGQNYVQLDLYMYGDYSSPYWPSPDHGNDWFIYPYFDSITPLLRMFEANNIACTLGFEYGSNYSLHGDGQTDYTNEEVWNGADTNAFVDKNGSQITWWYGTQRNFLRPEVQKTMIDNLDDMLGRYARYTSVKGIFFLEGGAWSPGFPAERIVPGNGSRPLGGDWDWLHSGYDDYTINLFETQTGINIPVSSAGKNRFIERYNWLKANAYDQWVQWRCEKVKEVNDVLRDHVVSARQDLLFAPIFGEFEHSPFLELAHRIQEKSYQQLLRETGRDPQLYIGQPGYLSFGELFPTDRTKPETTHQWSVEDYGAGRSGHLSQELAGLFANGSNTGLFDFEAFYEESQKIPSTVDWMHKGNNRGNYALSSGDFVRDRFVSSMWHWDPAYITFIWNDNTQYVGNEDNIRPFALAFRSLPLGNYSILSGQGRDKNIVIKKLQDKPVWALLNPGWWSMEVKLTISQPGVDLRDRVTGKIYSVTTGDVTLELRPFDLVVLDATQNVEITSTQALPDSEANDNLQGRLVDYQNVLNSAEAGPTSLSIEPASVSLTKGESQFVNAMGYDQNNRPIYGTIDAVVLGQLKDAERNIEQSLNNGDELSAWLTLETWSGRYPYIKAKEIMYSTVGSSNINVTWTSDDPAIATVDQNGLITGVASGTTVVKATYGQLSAQIDVTVNPSIPDNSINLALNKPATANTSDFKYCEPNKAVDGSLSTYWFPGFSFEYPLIFQVDLGSPTEFNKIILNEVIGSSEQRGRLLDYQIQYSIDGQNWSVADSVYGGASFTIPMNQHLSTTRVFPAVTGRYVRLYITNTLNTPALWEFEVHDVLPVNPTSISVNPASIMLIKGENQFVKAAVYDQNNNVMNELNINWTSDDPSIATVDQNGLITGVASGTTAVKATYGQLSAQIDVTVNPSIPDNSINLAYHKPATANTSDFKYCEPNKAVDGSLSTYWFPGFSFEYPLIFQVDLGSPTEFNKIILNELIGSSEQRGRLLDYQIQYSTDEQNWSVADSVYGGASFTIPMNQHLSTTRVFPAVTGRYVRLYITNTLNTPALWEFEVHDVLPVNPTSISVNPASLILSIGQSQAVTAAVYDQNGNIIPDVSVSWQSGNTGIASVDENGTVTGNGWGETVIQAIYGSLQAEIPVKVSPNTVASLTGSGKAYLGEKYDLTYGLSGAKDVSAQDITISYDGNVFELAGTPQSLEANTVVAEVYGISPGTVRFILATIGEGNGLNGSVPVLKLIFDVKAAASASEINIISAILANGNGDIVESEVVSKTVEVTDRTALDAAIQAAQELYGDAAEGISNGQYPAGAKVRLANAITAAAAVYNNPEATNGQFVEAASNLNAAADFFRSLVITSSTGDFNNKAGYDIGDIGIIAANYGKKAGDADWESTRRYDINGDGEIGLYELAFIAKRLIRN